MEAYLDNSATTRCSKAAADMVYKLLTEEFGKMCIRDRLFLRPFLANRESVSTDK